MQEMFWPQNVLRAPGSCQRSGPSDVLVDANVEKAWNIPEIFFSEHTQLHAASSARSYASV
jgi:hypothetical protein